MHGAGDESRKETPEEAAARGAVERLVAEGRTEGRSLDPLLWELLLVWRSRVFEHECLMRARLGALFAPPPNGESNQESNEPTRRPAATMFKASTVKVKRRPAAVVSGGEHEL